MEMVERKSPLSWRVRLKLVLCVGARVSDPDYWTLTGCPTIAILPPLHRQDTYNSFSLDISGYFYFKRWHSRAVQPLLSIHLHTDRLYIQISVLSFSHNNARFPKPERNNVSKHNYNLWVFFADATSWQTAKSLESQDLKLLFRYCCTNQYDRVVSEHFRILLDIQNYLKWLEIISLVLLYTLFQNIAHHNDGYNVIAI